MREPVFLKESSNAQIQIERLKEIEPLLNSEGQRIIQQDMKCLEYGIAGEEKIAFELKNSHMPMYILHDIYLEDGELSAQIDYLVFTKKLCFVIECKNLYGDIEIKSNGNFIRTMEFGGKKKKEGLYSPITQNQRHLELMKKIKSDQKSNMLKKYMTGKYFEDFNKSVVVLANPRTILNDRFAKKDIKKQVIRADQLVVYIKETYQDSKELEDSEERMLTWAQSYLKLHKEVEKDYTKKYEPYLLANNNSIAEKETAVTVAIEDSEIYKELKQYRLEKSRQENLKAYMIYNNSQLIDLIVKMPRNVEQLEKVSGFGPVKAEKYGEDILNMIEKYR